MARDSARSRAGEVAEPQTTARTNPVMMDVARLAGVSKQTVSRVFSDHPSVRQETRERVLSAARQLGFRPNSAARALITGRSRMLGVITSDATSYGPAAMLQAINAAARDTGYFVCSMPLRSMEHRAVLDALEQLTSQGVDGIIAIASQRTVVRALADTPRKLPMVTLDRSLDDRIPVVTVNEPEGARRATEHLLQLGHRTVWHLAGPSDWIAAEERAAGWRGALQDAGAEIHEPLVGDWSAGSGYALGRELALRDDVTAIFAANDQMAMGLVLALTEAGRQVPRDVSVIGFDDIPEAAFMVPPLTTVRPNFAEVGHRCITVMLDQLQDPARTRHHSVVMGELVVRRSSGPPPRRA